MAIVSPPTPANNVPMVLAANANTGAWGSFTNWDARCLCVFRGQLFFGASDGAVVQGWIGGSDQGAPYTGRYLPLFDDMGSPASRKISKLARVVMRSSVSLMSIVAAQYDWNMNMPAAPDATPMPALSVWDGATWNASLWDAESPSVICQRWRSVSGSGYAIGIGVQVTSAADVPLDAEIIRVDLTYETGDIVT